MFEVKKEEKKECSLFEINHVLGDPKEEIKKENTKNNNNNKKDIIMPKMVMKGTYKE